jgi:hypothetical protein
MRTNDTRRRVSKTELLSLGSAEEVEQLLARLTSSRLISAGGSNQETFVEVSHEALIREWPALREWVAAQRDSLRLERRLRQAAEEWESLKRDPGALLQGARLAQGEEWLTKSQEGPSLLREFLQASIAARDEAARKELATQKKEVLAQTRAAARLRWFSGSVVLLLLTAMSAAWYTYRLNLTEKSRVLAARADEIRSRDQGQALDLAIRGWLTAKTEEAHLAIAKAFPELLATLKHDGSVERAVFSPDGRRILTASDDHTARVWDSDDGRMLVVLQGHADKVEHATFSSDGQHIATASHDQTSRVWNSSDGRLLETLQGHKAGVIWVAFSRDGKRIVTASYDHTARIWNSEDGQLVATLQHDHVVARAEFSPDGKRVVTPSWDLTAQVWDSPEGR